MPSQAEAVNIARAWLDEALAEARPQLRNEFFQVLSRVQLFFEVLSYDVPVGSSLRSKDVLEFMSDKWIDDRVMNAISNVINTDPGTKSTFYMGNTEIQWALEQSDEVWTGYANNQLFKYLHEIGRSIQQRTVTYLIVPVHHGNEHWSFFTLDIIHGRLRYGDSLGTNDLLTWPIN
jgi:hypothetical protein